MTSRKLTLNRTTIQRLTKNDLQGVAGGPGHGTSNRCCPFSLEFCGSCGSCPETMCWCEGTMHTCFGCTAYTCTCETLCGNETCDC